jgi:hypothetical protein
MNKNFTVRYEYQGATYQTVISAKTEAEALKHFNEFAGGAALNPRIISDQPELCLQ